jgi:RNA polymerase sigma-70 factor, ECF subfamily
MSDRDQGLIAALRAGEEQAFTRFFNAYVDAMYRLALGLLGDEAEAEDVVQESFARVLTQLDSFRGEARLNVWLYRVVYNACISRLRHRRPVGIHLEELDEGLPLPQALVDCGLSPEDILQDRETSVALDEAIAQLPESLRAVFILRDIEELSTAEAAAALETTVGAVKVRLHRARLLLRESLSVHFGERYG